MAIEFSVKLARRLFVGGGGLFGGGEDAEMILDASYRDSCLPFIAASLTNPAITRRVAVSNSPIPALFHLRRGLHIAPAVITAISIFVVNGLRRFFAGHQFPNDAMYVITSFVDSDAEIFKDCSPCKLARKPFAPDFPPPCRNEVIFRSGFPAKLAGLGIIVETFAQIFDRWQDSVRVWLGHRTGSYGSEVKWRGGAYDAASLRILAALSTSVQGAPGG